MVDLWSVSRSLVGTDLICQSGQAVDGDDGYAPPVFVAVAQVMPDRVNARGNSVAVKRDDA